MQIASSCMLWTLFWRVSSLSVRGSKHGDRIRGRKQFNGPSTFSSQNHSTAAKNLMAKNRTAQILSPNPLDYPSGMSGYEKDSLVAEAILAAKKKKKRRPNAPQNARWSEKAMGNPRWRLR